MSEPSELIEQCKIEVSSEQAEQIVRDYIEARMISNGYKLINEVKQDDNYWPSVLYRGDKV